MHTSGAIQYGEPTNVWHPRLFDNPSSPLDTSKSDNLSTPAEISKVRATVGRQTEAESLSVPGPSQRLPPLRFLKDPSTEAQM